MRKAQKSTLNRRTLAGRAEHGTTATNRSGPGLGGAKSSESHQTDPQRASTRLGPESNAGRTLDAGSNARPISPFLIDSPLRLEIAAIPTKQRPAHISNRYSNSHFWTDCPPSVLSAIYSQRTSLLE
jgi:hypothetical protein